MNITIENGRDIRLSGITPNDSANVVPWLGDLDYVSQVIRPKLSSEVVVRCKRGRRNLVLGDISELIEAAR